MPHPEDSAAPLVPNDDSVQLGGETDAAFPPTDKMAVAPVVAEGDGGAAELIAGEGDAPAG